jgi:hypothetical protein
MSVRRLRRIPTITNRRAIKKPKTGKDILEYMKKELFSSTYLTMLSIIQGVSLGFIMLNSAIFWDAAKETGNYSFWIYSPLSLLILFLIWYEYVYNLLFPRVPNLRDNIFPFLFGIFQIISSFFLNNPRNWLIITAVLGVLGYFAYKNTRDKFPKEDYTKKVGTHFSGFQLTKMKFMVVLAVISLLFRFMYFISSDSPIGFIKKDISGFFSKSAVLKITLIDFANFLIISSSVCILIYLSRRLYKDLERI